MRLVPQACVSSRLHSVARSRRKRRNKISSARPVFDALDEADDVAAGGAAAEAMPGAGLGVDDEGTGCVRCEGAGRHRLRMLA
jgi:hypothetical protein